MESRSEPSAQVILWGQVYESHAFSPLGDEMKVREILLQRGEAELEGGCCRVKDQMVSSV